MIKSIEDAKTESTCQKRIIVCEIFDVDGKLLARESNRCEPEGETCHRIGVVQAKEGYDVNSSCNWTHAEIMAINALPNNSRPYKAVISGHDFYCDACEEALKNIGVEILEIKK